RDDLVTGVQTCALPIYSAKLSPDFERSITRSTKAATPSASETDPSDQASPRMSGCRGEAGLFMARTLRPRQSNPAARRLRRSSRSEERRVGEGVECAVG